MKNKYLTSYLKTSTEQELISTLKEVLQTDEEGNLITATHDYCLILLPNLTEPTGNMLTDEEGNEYPERVPVEGFHANLRTKDQTIIDQLEEAGVVVFPETPVVIFA